MKYRDIPIEDACHKLRKIPWVHSVTRRPLEAMVMVHTSRAQTRGFSGSYPHLEHGYDIALATDAGFGPHAMSYSSFIWRIPEDKIEEFLAVMLTVLVAKKVDAL